MFSFDNFDVAIQIVSSINCGKVLLHAEPQQSAVGCNAQQCLPMRPSGCHMLQYRFFWYITGFHIGWQHCLGKFRSAWQWFFAHWCWSWNASPMHIQGLLLPCLCTSLVKCFYICRNNAKHWFLLSNFFSFGLAFQSSRSPMYWRLSWQNSSGQFLQKFVLIGFSINSRKAVIREVLTFPADCSKRTGMSLISTFSKFSGLNLMCFEKWVGVGGCIATKKLCQCTVDFAIRVALAFYSSYVKKQFIIYCTQTVEFDHKVVAIFSQFFKVSVASLYWHIQFFKLL